MNINIFIALSIILFMFYLASIVFINAYGDRMPILRGFITERKMRGIFLIFQSALLFYFLLFNPHSLSIHSSFILPTLFFLSGLYYFLQNNQRNDYLYLGIIWVVGFILILLVGLADYQSAKRKLDEIRMENQIKEKKTE